MDRDRFDQFIKRLANVGMVDGERVSAAQVRRARAGVVGQATVSLLPVWFDSPRRQGAHVFCTHVY